MRRQNRWMRIAVLAAFVTAEFAWALAWAQQSPGGGGRLSPANQRIRSNIRERAQEGSEQDSGPGGRTTGGTTAPVQSVSGGGGGGGGGVRVTGGGGGTFQPIKSRPVEYEELPLEDGPVLSNATGPMPVSQFLNIVTQSTGWNVMTTPNVEKVTLNFTITEKTPKEALAVLRFHNVYYEYDEDTGFVHFMTVDEYLQREYGNLVQEQFTVEHANIADVEQALTTLQSPQGTMTVDPRTSTIFVRDTDDNINHMQRMVYELDVPIETQSYSLSYITAEVLVDSVEQMLSERGTMNIDPRTNKVIVTDHPTRQDRIAEMIKTLDQELVTESWTLNYADPDIVAEQVETLVPDEMGTISVDPRVNRVTVTAIPSRIQEISELVDVWDVRRKQVQIEAYLVTVSTNVVRNLGINWALFGEIEGDPFGFQFGNANPQFNNPPTSGQRFSIGQLPIGLPEIDPTNPATGGQAEDIQGNPLLRKFTGSELSVVLDMLETRGDATILASPEITVQDGEEAIFENTTSVPFSQSTADRPVSVPQTGGGFRTDFRSISRIEFIDVGTILRVMPRISGENTVLLDISAEDSSSQFIEVIGADQVNTVPQKTQNRAETQVLADDGSTIVIGGLRTSNYSDDQEKVPVLGDLPLFGRLFRSDNRDHQESELLIFITPTIVESGTHPAAKRLAKRDEDLARTLRDDQKDGLKRIADNIQDPPREIMVAIGQSGSLFSEGKMKSLDELRELFFAKEAEVDVPTTVVIRAHPRAPEDAELALTEAALEAGLDVEYDDSVIPFVPSLPANGGKGASN